MDDDAAKLPVSEESPNLGEKGEDEGDLLRKTEILDLKERVNSPSENSSNDAEGQIHGTDDSEKDINEQVGKSRSPDAMEPTDSNQTVTEILEEEKSEDPVFDGTEVPEMEGLRRSSDQSVEFDSEAQQGSVINERAAAIRDFVKEKGAIASTFIRRLSGRKDENDLHVEDDKNDASESGNSEKTVSDSEMKPKEAQKKSEERTSWNPLNLIKIGGDNYTSTTGEAGHGNVPGPLEQPTAKGRIILYTKLGCEDCKMVRLFLYQQRLKYVEINIDIFPSRKLELEKNTGSTTVPKVYFNDLLIGGLTELKKMEESGILDERTGALFKDEPSSAAPLPPLPGEDDESGCGKMDELATIVRKMRETITPKDRFYKMRRFSNCFPGSEAVDFISEDQYLERDEVKCLLLTIFLSVPYIVLPYGL
jgi:glutaredoxin